jgi:hypothetical protein
LFIFSIRVRDKRRVSKQEGDTTNKSDQDSNEDQLLKEHLKTIDDN